MADWGRSVSALRPPVAVGPPDDDAEFFGRGLQADEDFNSSFRSSRRGHKDAGGWSFPPLGEELGLRWSASPIFAGPADGDRDGFGGRGYSQDAVQGWAGIALSGLDNEDDLDENDWDGPAYPPESNFVNGIAQYAGNGKKAGGRAAPSLVPAQAAGPRGPRTFGGLSAISAAPMTLPASNSFASAPPTAPATPTGATSESRHRLYDAYSAELASGALVRMGPPLAGPFTPGSWAPSSPGPALAAVQPPAAPPTPLALARQWVANYGQQPLLHTPQMYYPGGAVVNFYELAPAFGPLAAANAAHRMRLVPALESGDLARQTLPVYCACDRDQNGFLSWNNGEIRDFIATVFRQHGLFPPDEYQMFQLYVKFDMDKNAVLDARECLCLVDALFRSTFFTDPAVVPMVMGSAACMAPLPPPQQSLPPLLPMPPPQHPGQPLVPQAGPPMSGAPAPGVALSGIAGLRQHEPLPAGGAQPCYGAGPQMAPWPPAPLEAPTPAFPMQLPPQQSVPPPYPGQQLMALPPPHLPQPAALHPATSYGPLYPSSGLPPHLQPMLPSSSHHMGLAHHPGPPSSSCGHSFHPIDAEDGGHPMDIHHRPPASHQHEQRPHMLVVDLEELELRPETDHLQPAWYQSLKYYVSLHPHSERHDHIPLPRDAPRATVDGKYLVSKTLPAQKPEVNVSRFSFLGKSDSDDAAKTMPKHPYVPFRENLSLNLAHLDTHLVAYVWARKISMRSEEVNLVGRALASLHEFKYQRRSTTWGVFDVNESHLRVAELRLRYFVCTTPGPVRRPRASHVRQTEVTVEWDAPASDHGSPLVGYWVGLLMKLDEHQDEGPKWATVCELTKTLNTSFTIKNLKGNTAYLVDVRAVNKVGAGDPCEFPITTAPCEPDAPNKPWVEEKRDGCFNVAWYPPVSDGGFPVTSYRIKMRKIMGATRRTRFLPVCDAPASWIDMGIIPASDKEQTEPSMYTAWVGPLESHSCEYRFQIFAVNKAGESMGSELSDPEYT